MVRRSGAPRRRLPLKAIGKVMEFSGSREQPPTHILPTFGRYNTMPEDMLVVFQPPVEVGSAAFEETIFFHNPAIVVLDVRGMARVNNFDAVHPVLDHFEDKFFP